MRAELDARGASPARPQARITRKSRIDYVYELRELIRRRQLIKYLTSSMLKAGHRQMVLGELWWLLDPVLHMLVFTVLVTVIFQRGVPNYPVFVFCAILPYRWFTQAVSQSQQLITSIGPLMRDVAFPKAVYPIALNNSNFVNFLFGFLFLVAMTFYFEVPVTWAWLWLIPLWIQFYSFSLGVSLLLSGFTVLFLDLKNIMNFVFQVLFYMSPALYPVEFVPERYRDLYMLNPFAIMFTAWRDVILHGRAPDVGAFAIMCAMSAALLVLGYTQFVRLEKVFAKTV